MRPRLWIVAVELFGPRGSQLVRTVVDTGATATLMPPEALAAIGCDPALSRDRARIVTASGTEYLAVVDVPEIKALGHRIHNLQVMSHALPFSSSVNGLLGMDFLLNIASFQRLHKRFNKFFV